MFFVARVDTLGAVAAEKVLVEFETAELFQNRHAVFFCAARVNGGFVNYDITRFKCLAYGFAGFDEGCEVRALVLVNGGGYCDDEAVAGTQIIQVAAELQVPCGLQF